MIIHQPEVTRSNGRFRYSAVFEIETPGIHFLQTQKSTQAIWFDWPDDYFPPEANHSDSFLIIGLPIAMRLGERLKVSGKVSETLLINALEVVAILNSYFPHLTKIIDIQAQTETRDIIADNRIASFNSGGVDALYNIAENARLQKKYKVQPITDLWLVWGLDMKFHREKLWAQRKQQFFESMSNEKNIRCVDIITNTRNELLDLKQKTYLGPMVNRYDLGYGPSLAAISKCFAPNVGTVLVGSSLTYDKFIPRSCTPLMDQMWSCDQQKIRHFAGRARRIEKIKTIIENKPELFTALRVCTDGNTKTMKNCGVCEKCMRTQCEIICTGKTEYLNLFESPVTTKMLRQIELEWRSKKQTTWPFWEEIQESFKEMGLKKYASALGFALRRNRLRRSFRRMIHDTLGLRY